MLDKWELKQLQSSQTWNQIRDNTKEWLKTFEAGVGSADASVGPDDATKI